MLSERRNIALLSACVLVLVASSCASSWRREPVFSRDGVAVYREWKLSESGDGTRVDLGHLHPIELPRSGLEALVSELSYVRQSLFDSPSEQHVFPAERLDLIVEGLEVGLSSVSDDERVRFLVMDDELRNIFVGTTGVSGVMFRTRDGRIHLAFDRIRQGINDGEEGRAEDVIFPHEPLEMQTGSPLVPPAGARRHVADGVDYPRWIELTEVGLVALGAAMSEMEEARKEARNEVADEIAEGESKGQTVPAAALVDVAESVDIAESVDVAESDDVTQSVDAAGTGAPPRDELRRRIELLESLRDDGTLSEEDYQAQLERALRGP